MTARYFRATLTYFQLPQRHTPANSSELKDTSTRPQGQRTHPRDLKDTPARTRTHPCELKPTALTPQNPHSRITSNLRSQAPNPTPELQPQQFKQTYHPSANQPLDPNPTTPTTLHPSPDPTHRSKYLNPPPNQLALVSRLAKNGTVHKVGFGLEGLGCFTIKIPEEC